MWPSKTGERKGRRQTRKEKEKETDKQIQKGNFENEYFKKFTQHTAKKNNTRSHAKIAQRVGNEAIPKPIELRRSVCHMEMPSSDDLRAPPPSELLRLDDALPPCDLDDLDECDGGGCDGAKAAVGT
jgi:hypothetical protein